jgi:AAT family amino acid transporter
MSDLSSSPAKQEEGLLRSLKSRHVQLIALGGIIGSSYFLGSGYIISQTGPASFLAYIFGGIIVYMVMLCLGELAVAIPISGSFISYANDLLSPTLACGIGWSYWTTWVTFFPSEMIAAGIIMHNFIPQILPQYWAIIFGIILTLINIGYVEYFGEVEFWLALIKIISIGLFCIVAVLIFFGITDHGFIGTKYILHNGGFFPKGITGVFLTMVIVLVNYQGSELIGLAAGESISPEKSIPVAIKNVSTRIISLYVIPILLLVLIYPWDKSGLQESVFAAALNHYGFRWIGGFFSFVVLTAAISCSNSGLYGTIRVLYGLSMTGLAPKWLGKLNRYRVPQNAAIVTILPCWIGIIIYTSGIAENAYTYLLALSGFTGAVAWIAICWCQLVFRYRWQKLGDEAQPLKYKTPFFPYLTHFAIWSQVACMVIMMFSPDLRASFYIGFPILIIPMIWYKIKKQKYRKVT